MTLQKIYIQYEYQLHEYFLPDAELYVRDSMTGGDIFGEICYSAFDGTSTGCGFNLTEGWTYDVFSGKEGYKTGSNSQLLEFAPPVDPYILLWLYPREPSVVTHDATEITSTSAELNGELTNLDGCDEIYICFQYGKVGESYTQLEESWYTSTDTFYEEVTGLTPDTTYNFRIRGGNETEEDTFYVFGETKQFTTLPAAEPPVVYTYDTDEITESSALLRGYLGTSGGIGTDVGFEYGETTSYGTSFWSDAYTEPGYFSSTVTGLDQNTLYHVRAVAHNDYGTGHGVDKTFTTLEETVGGMQLVLPNPYSLLFVDHTLIACDDETEACAEFTFQIRNDGAVTSATWYRVSIVDGGTLYDSMLPALDPGVTSAEVSDLVCALPGGLPVGTHTIKVEVGPTGMPATDTYTEDIFVIEEGVVEGMQITLPYPNLLEDDTIITCDDPTKACTYFNFQIKNSLTYGWWPYYEVSIVGGATLYTGSPDYLAAGASTPIIRDAICALPDGLPIGEHTIEVKAYPAWGSVTDTYTEEIYVIEEGVDDMQIMLPYTTLLEKATITYSDNETEGCTPYNFRIRNKGSTTIAPWYKLYIDNYLKHYNTIATLTPEATSPIIDDILCAIADGIDIGTHTIKVEVGPEGQAASDTYSEDIFVIEAPVQPEVNTGWAATITQTSAVLSGLLSECNAVTTHIGFEYGKTTSYGTTVWDSYTSSFYSYETEVTGLASNTTYHFRAIATNEYGTGYGNDMTFTTLPWSTDITFIATAPGISDLHNVDVNDITDPENPKYLGTT